MNFEDFQYVSLICQLLKVNFERLFSQFNESESFHKLMKAMKEMIKLRNDFDTMPTLVSIRHSIDTLDEFYEKEMDFFDENNPIILKSKLVIIIKH